MINKNKKRNRRVVFKPIIVFIDDMNKFKQKEMKKKRPIKTLGVIS